jgi:segregation and condensation protein B
MRTAQIVEALLFASDAPLSAADLVRGDEGLDEEQVEAAIEELRADYEAGERSFQIYEIGGGYQILTRPEFAPYLERFDTVPQNPRLSGPALEVLAVIAYRQPIGRAEIEEIRGVGSAGVLRTLLDRGVVEVVARGEGLGRPLLYGTTQTFLEHFGFRSLEDLPRPEELPVVLRAREPGDEARATGDENVAENESEAAATAGEAVRVGADVPAAGDSPDFRAAGGGDGEVDGDGHGDGEA